MVNEYLVNKEDLTTVANAIREKTGSSGDLSFPDGFVSAIDNITSGEELQFSVVGGTSQPSSPAENTIWINTGTNITSWIFSSEQPSSASAGMVWIITSANSNIKFDAISNNAIYVYPVHAKQYIYGSWQDKPIKVYQSGGWKENITKIYYIGDTCDALTGGWSSTGYSCGSAGNVGFSTGTSQLIFYTRSGSETNKTAAAGTVNPIVITGKKTLKVIGSVSNYQSQSMYAIGIASTKGNMQHTAVASIWITAGGTFEKTLDISDFSGSYYIIAAAATDYASGVYDSYMYIDQIILE